MLSHFNYCLGKAEFFNNISLKKNLLHKWLWHLLHRFFKNHQFQSYKRGNIVCEYGKDISLPKNYMFL